MEITQYELHLCIIVLYNYRHLCDYIAVIDDCSFIDAVEVGPNQIHIGKGTFHYTTYI